MNGKKTIRVLPKRLLLIGAIVLVIAVFGRLRTFAGGLIGQAAEDGSMVFDGAADVETEGKEATLPNGETVYIPAKDEFLFNSEDVMQNLDIGNPAENTRMMKMIMMMGEQQIFETGILRQGKGIAEGRVDAIFKPGTYDMTMVYIFYEEPESKLGRLKEIGRAENALTLTSEGSGERFAAAEARKDKEKKKDKKD